jgi:acyl-coenzyme A synthetase/AMP-(fatty) acid ligase
MSQSEAHSLSDLIEADSAASRPILVKEDSLSFGSFRNASSLCEHIDELKSRSVMIMADDQLRVAAALIDLDGWVRRIVICPPDFEARHFSAVVRDAEVDSIVHDGGWSPQLGRDISLVVPCKLPLQPRATRRDNYFTTEWVLLTSGTTGDPKMVVHTLATLTKAIPRVSASADVENWGTFYDIRRYGGLQIFLRSCAGNGSLTLRSANETIDSFLTRASVNNVTHISGTPSHWRLVLMNDERSRINPKYVRLSGEIADESLIHALSALYPRARVAHAYASTEAGVLFEIEDGQAGFPRTLLEKRDRDIALKVVDSTLHARSSGSALRYLGATPPRLFDQTGFIDTGDFVQRQGDRYFFSGRRGGIINVGGAKVNPEEVEAIINQHASVHASLVKARRNPIAGSVVVADVVLKEGVVETAELNEEIRSECATRLAPYKVPALVRFVPNLDVTDAGKLRRN